MIATVNWSEVCQHLARRTGAPAAAADQARARLSAAGLRFEPLSVADAEDAARLQPATRPAGLSLADRCCFALARRLQRPALTADGVWVAVDVGVDIRLIR